MILKQLEWLGEDWRKFFLGSKFSRSCSYTILSTFMRVLPRSVWNTHFHLSDRVDSSTKMLVLMSRMHFWNIWSDWVKIGKSSFWSLRFHKLVDLTVLSTFVQVLPRSEWKTHFHLSDLFDSGTKMQLLMSIMWFWNIWSDRVKSGENFFEVRKFSQSCRSHRSEHFSASFAPI